MALRKNITMSNRVKMEENGLIGFAQATCSESVYIKVTNVDSAKDNAKAFVSYLSDNISGQQMYSFTVDLEGKNFIAQAYEYLKTLPEFADATDV